MIKLLILALGVCQAQASYGVYNGESGLYSNYHGEYAASYDNYIPKPYAFEYGVSDPHTGDHKSQWETKDTTGVVRGSYSLLEPDGTTRVVDYIADKAGFRAVVKRVNIHGYASVESHGGVEPLGQIIAAEPIASVVLPQPELVVKQPVLYNDHRQIFSSYDGGAEDYQNLLPYQLQVPVSHSIPVEIRKHEYEQTGILSPEKSLLFASQAPGIYSPQQHQQPQDTILHESGPGIATYNRQQPIYQQGSLEYQQPIQVHHQESFPETKSYQQVEPAPTYYQSIPEIQTYKQVSSASTYEQPISDYESNQKVVSAPAYPGNLPVDGYNLETVYGQETVRYDSNSLGSQSNTVYHPHGKSSQSFAGSTGYQEGVKLHQ